MTRLDSITAEQRGVTAALRRQHEAGAVAPGTYAALLRRRYQLDDERAETTGIRVLHLVCGHERRVDVGTYEEADMERTGTVQCRAIKPVIGWPSHRWQYVGVLGWSGS